jgi:16S rRNA (guanine527-N7)-methyltransferase
MTPEKFQIETGVSRETLQLFEAYQSITIKWQGKINLISPTTIDDIFGRHFFDSAQIFPLLSDDDIIVDLGSGAGFPGLVLALMSNGRGRSTNFHLVEADSRKAAFLIEVAIATGLLNRTVQIHAVRAEKLATGPLARSAGIVTARALAALPDLLTYAAPLLAPGGRCLFLKGERAHDEVAAARAAGWSFDLAQHPSRTEPGASILEIHTIRHDPRLAAPRPRKL